MSPGRCTRVLFMVTLLVEASLSAKQKQPTDAFLETLQSINVQLKQQVDNNIIVPSAELRTLMNVARREASHLDSTEDAQAKLQARQIITSIVQKRNTILARAQERKREVLGALERLRTINNRLTHAVADGTVIPRKQIKHELSVVRRLADRLDKLTSEKQKKSAQQIIASIKQNKTTLVNRCKQHAAESAGALKQLRAIDHELARALNGMSTTVNLKDRMKTAQQLAQKLDRSGTPAQRHRARKLILSTIDKRNRLIETADRHDGVLRETSNVKKLVALWSDMLERAHSTDSAKLTSLLDDECQQCITHAKQLARNVHKRKKEARRLVEDMLEAKHRMLKAARKQIQPVIMVSEQVQGPEQTASVATTIEASTPKVTMVAERELKQIKRKREQEAEQLKREQEIITWLHNVIAELAHETTSIQQTGHITVSARTLHEIEQETTAQTATIVNPENTRIAQKLLESIAQGRAALRKHAKELIHKTEMSFHKTLAEAGVKDIETVAQQVQQFIRTVRDGVPERALAMEEALHDRLVQLEHEKEQRARKKLAADNTRTAVQVASVQEVVDTNNGHDNDKHTSYEPTELELQYQIDKKLHKLAAAPNKAAVADAVHELGPLFRSLEKRFDWAHELVQKNRNIAISLLRDWNDRHKPSSLIAQRVKSC